MKTELTLKLKLGEKRAVELTKSEAREVYEVLKEIFEPEVRSVCCEPTVKEKKVNIFDKN